MAAALLHLDMSLGPRLWVIAESFVSIATLSRSHLYDRFVWR